MRDAPKQSRALRDGAFLCALGAIASSRWAHGQSRFAQRRASLFAYFLVQLTQERFSDTRLYVRWA